ncbi:uncharacterized protein LOC117879996 [Trachemys scripta elegans]|uniref:uncharacterized protein LOC117879996 n=1 Tax=Trachemys scripta elegans TaxID=31138 RepID=UPI0015575120|nr:uncharacterized protein LOC117879996 [Trachemys scripta elegans]
MSLKDQHLAFGSLKVHLAAISAFHPGAAARSVFAHPIVRRFLKGLEKIHPPTKSPMPAWDLNLVLSCLMGPPFEPLATCSLLYLSWKVTFLVAITSARRVSELRALTCEPPYTIFQLRPHPAFLPKVLSRFHVSQDIFLPVFYPKPHAHLHEQRLHSLDVRRTLTFYIDRTKPFRKTTQLFVAIAKQIKGAPVSSQLIFLWLTGCICACYNLANVLPPAVTAHSTRAQA